MDRMAGSKNKGFARTFQSKDLLQILVVGNMSVVDQGYDLRILAAAHGVEEPHPLRLADVISHFGENNHQTVAAFFQCPRPAPASVCTGRSPAGVRLRLRGAAYPLP